MDVHNIDIYTYIYIYAAPTRDHTMDMPLAPYKPMPPVLAAESSDQPKHTTSPFRAYSVPTKNTTNMSC